MGILTTAYLKLNKIKVVSSIPGRLRLLIPNLNKIPKDMQKYDYYTTNLLKSLGGIESVEYSFLTNKVLITYDQNKINETKIVYFLNRAMKIIAENYKQYEDMDKKDVVKNLDNFYAMLKKKLEAK